MNLTRLDPELLELKLTGFEERGYDFVDDALVLRLKQLQPEHGILSIYLDTSPATLANTPAMTRFEHAIDAVRKARELEWDHAQKTTFDRMVKDLSAQLEKMLARPQGRGIALFAAPARVLPKKEKVDYEIFCSFHLPHPPADRVEWGESPVLTPLLIQRDESPRTGVVHFDREQIRSYLAFMGEVARYELVLKNDDPVPLTKSHAWHGYGEHNHQQWQEHHYQRYLAQAALAVEKLAQAGDWKWLVLASPDSQEADHLCEHLHGSVKERVIGTCSLPMDSDLNQVRDTVLPIIAEAEKEEEKARLQHWAGELERADGKAVAGLADTLLAVEEYRVYTLLADEGYCHKGWQCNGCGGLVADLMEEPPAECPYCGSTELKELPDIVGEMAVRVINSGGDVEIVHDPDNRKIIEEKGQVGGLLRY